MIAVPERVVLSADMEGISQITDARELLACCTQYWETGRERMTADVVAAAAGLLDAGVREVIVLDNHASGHPQNVISAALPEGARLETWEVYGLADRGVDAMLQVGYHPRSALAGFAPHTYTVGLRLWAGAEEISESHGRAWASKLALLGITGHTEHGRTLGSLDGTPFLAVQGGEDPLRGEPQVGDAPAAADSIRSFAQQCARGFGDARVGEPPNDPSVRAALRSVSDAQAAQFVSGGWVRAGDLAFEAELSDWRNAGGLLKAAMGAAMLPFMDDLIALDLSSEEAVAHEDSERPARLAQDFLDSLAAAWPSPAAAYK